MRIIFMGTPDFAVASLDALIKAGCSVIAVVTAPDKPAGRGQKINESAVKKYAVQKGLPVLQPVKLKDPTFIDELKQLQADLQVVVAFRMLPEVVWNMPPKGTVNLHASLLPQYRGAAPINWAIINGEKETGVTTFLLKQEIDTGDILFGERVEIGPDETAGELHDKLMHIGAKLLVKTVKAIQSGEYQPMPQEEIEIQYSKLNVERLTSKPHNSRLATHNPQLNHAPKIFKEDCKIEWNAPVKKVYNFIRGLSPYPTAYTHLQGKMLKIFMASPEMKKPDIPSGNFLTDNKTYLKFACADGFIYLCDMQLEGKKRMSVEEFLRGIRL